MRRLFSLYRYLQIFPSKNVALRILAAAVLLLCLTGVSYARERGKTQGQVESPPKRPKVIRFPLTKFYDTPDPLPSGKPGELIRSMEFGAYDVPLNVAAVRYLYHSRSASGVDVVSSGVVLFPDKKPPAGGWPVIAWAHDISGVARQCAPSLAKNLQHGSFLSMYAGVGYAVVATDYTGLGTKFRNASTDMLSNAWDVIYSVPAARRAVPQLGARWIAMGIGEGGRAAVTVAQLEREVRDPSYLGSIAISRLADFEDMYPPASNFSTASVLLLAYGIKAVFPAFNPKDILTDQALSLFEKVGQACEDISGAAQNIGDAAMVRPNWKNNQFVQQYFDRNRLGTQPAAAPLMVITSADDPALKDTTKVVDRLCKQGDGVQFEKYPEYDPGRVVGDSVRDQMAWIEARFAGRAAPSDCRSK